MRYPLAERFKAVQGEGEFAGTPMAFIRLVGCSVGQTICTACDTDFSAMHPPLGGGLYSVEELVEWVGNYHHVCITGGEPLDRDLRPLIQGLQDAFKQPHIETSGTKHPDWLDTAVKSRWIIDKDGGSHVSQPVWVTVSPKPGWLPSMIERANEVKVILGGLGEGPGWPDIPQAVQWAKAGKLVYIQQRNGRLVIDRESLYEAIATVDAHPSLRLSVQLHKFIGVR